MLSSTNFWMGFAGLIYLVAGVFILRKEIGAARGWDKLITLALSSSPFHSLYSRLSISAARSLSRVWSRAGCRAHWFWAYFVGCALLAAATSLTLRKFMRLSSTLLGLMFFLFVCMIYLPSALRHPRNRFAWIYRVQRPLFCAGAWALAGLYSRASSPQVAKWMILFARLVLAIAAIFYAVQHFLHPESVPDVPLEKMTPSWVPFPSLWGYLGGAVLLAAGIGLAAEQEISDGCNLDWRMDDRRHSIPVSAYVGPRPRRTGDE